MKIDERAKTPKSYGPNRGLMIAALGASICVAAYYFWNRNTVADKAKQKIDFAQQRASSVYDESSKAAQSVADNIKANSKAIGNKAKEQMDIAQRKTEIGQQKAKEAQKSAKSSIDSASAK